jgi:hypothetical protein
MIKTLIVKLLESRAQYKCEDQVSFGQGELL